MSYKIKAREIVNKLLNSIAYGQEIDINQTRNTLIENIQTLEDEDKELIQKEALKTFDLSFQPVAVRQERRVKVVNFPVVPKYPNEIKINNLSELKEYFESLKEAFNIPAPEVNVKAPIINVPAPIVNVPAFPGVSVDLYPLLDALSNIQYNSKENPLAVRLTDGIEWIEQLIKVQEETQKAVAAFAGGNDQVRIRDANNNIINPATSDSPSTLLHNLVTVTTAGTEVQVSATSVPIKGITIKALAANTGTMYVGSSTVASTNGYPLAAGQAISFDISNLNTVWVDASVNGEKVSYLAVN